jgi:hypothetical protein
VFDSRHYQILWEVVGLERGPLSYLNEKVAAPVKKTRINDRGDPLRWPRDTLYQQKLAPTSPTSGGRSVGIVRLRTISHGVFSRLLGQMRCKSPMTNIASESMMWMRSFQTLHSLVPLFSTNWLNASASSAVETSWKWLLIYNFVYKNHFAFDVYGCEIWSLTLM